MAAPSDDPLTHDWQHCGIEGALAGQAGGCRGLRISGQHACLAHLSPSGRSEFLRELAPEANIDLRGTHIDEHLLSQLLDAVRDASGHPSFGAANFIEAVFPDGADFSGSTFESLCFNKAHFGDRAQFKRIRVSESAYLFDLTGTSVITFAGAVFSGHSLVIEGEFGEGAYFSHVRFESTETRIGPLVCGDRAVFGGSQFRSPVSIEISTPYMRCRDTHWSSTAAIRLRYAETDFSNSWFEFPVSVSAAADPFTATLGRPVSEALVSGDPGVRFRSMRGVDAANLMLTDIDLSDCEFAGAFHLDQLRLYGNCVFSLSPTGLHLFPIPRRWTIRRTLAEEHHWRASRPAGATDGWRTNIDPERSGQTPGPQHLAALYRELRKALEDAKNEPGAADFYYGEMGMRRCDSGAPRSERFLLYLYWALSGYGLRALRAISWLLLAMVSTILAMMFWGLPKDDPKVESTGSLKGQNIVMTTDTPDPVNPDGAYARRLTTERFEKSLRVVINSVVFRSSGQELTTTGTYAEMASRVSEPVLLGLAVLAVRGRVKR
ncbi:pentapeptide repeat-containing protein [Streptomyces avermitilis]|uniref:pentapeptide repeat-containing protein n=1 Tax=Streptomyces avermitilis TaxID=33903 RepID=UPI0033A21824